MKYLLKKLPKRWDLLALGLICLFILVSHTFYVLKTHQYPEMDEQHYMDMATTFYKLLQNPSWETPWKIITYLPFRQPGYSLFITPFLLILGIQESYKVALFLNGIFYVVTVASLYFLAREYFNKVLSLTGTIIFAFYGWSLFYLHFTYSETATTTFVVLSLLFLLKSSNFKNKKNSILFGICFGLGLLTRWVTPVFLAGPIVYVLYEWFRSKNKKIKNIALAFLITLTISFLPYLLNRETFFGEYFKSQFLGGPLWSAIPSYRKFHISFQSAAYYFKVFEQLTIFLFVPFILGLIAAFLNWKKYLYIILAFLSPYLLFSFGTIIKDDRYIVPIYPVIALITVIILNEIRKKRTSVFVTAFLILVSILNFFGGVWAIGPMGQEGLKSIVFKLPFDHQRRIHLATIVWPPTKEFSNAKLIMDALEEDIKTSKVEKPKIVDLFSYHPIDNALYAINKYERLRGYYFESFILFNPKDKNLVQDVSDALNNADYILFKRGGVISDGYFGKQNYVVQNEINFALANTNYELLSSLKELKEIEIPLDKSTLIIYKNINKNHLPLLSLETSLRQSLNR